MEQLDVDITNASSGTSGNKIMLDGESSLQQIQANVQINKGGLYTKDEQIGNFLYSKDRSRTSKDTRDADGSTSAEEEEPNDR